MRGRNTENSIVKLDRKMDNYQRKQYVVMSFTHEEKYIVFNDIGKGKRKKEVYSRIEVIIAMD